MRHSTPVGLARGLAIYDDNAHWVLSCWHYGLLEFSVLIWLLLVFSEPAPTVAAGGSRTKDNFSSTHDFSSCYKEDHFLLNIRAVFMWQSSVSYVIVLQINVSVCGDALQTSYSANTWGGESLLASDAAYEVTAQVVAC